MYYILFTTDENFSQHCGVCIVSLLKNNINTKFSIVVAGVGLSQETRDNLIDCTNDFANVEINFVDFEEEKLNDFPQIRNYRKSIYLRLWVDEFFGENVKSVLYLDVDTIVVGTITELFEIELDNFIIGAVDIPFSDSHKRCHLPLEYNYFNSGVLLFNLERWRKEDCRKKILSFLIKNESIAFNPDQDALNGVFYKDRLTLDYTYNLISPFFRKSELIGLGNNRLNEIRRNAKIIHFNGRSRPWFYTCNHPYQKQYIKYLKYTPWKDYIPPDRNFLNFLKKNIRIFIGKESFVRIGFLNGN